jgi:hypothetical protein
MKHMVMNIYKIKWAVPLILLASTFILASCNTNPIDNNNNNNNNNNTSETKCYVQLFDSGHYIGGTIAVKGPGIFGDLGNLPGASKNWNNKADSFKSGKGTTVTFWTETDFEGDSTTYSQAPEKTPINGPNSMKIKCSETE